MNEAAPVVDETPGPVVRGAALLRRLEAPWLRLERWTARLLPDDLDPLRNTGAVANVSLLVALVTGVALLVWYSPSVHQAHASLEAMSAAPWTAGLVRSLHRYSSDACMLFALIHALRLLLARRLVHARWLAWVTGVALLALLWLVGWLGYWLVWDVRAQHVALGTARLLDALPVFAEPPSRAFLTDATVNSLLFFVVFFSHMLIPLGMGALLWLHIARVARPRFLAGRGLTACVLLALLVASVAHPATSEAPARMTAAPRGMTIDAWYLLPLLLSDRLGGGLLWAVALLGTTALASLPWTLAGRRPAPAAVDPARCNGCRQCSLDCPFGAIRMVPRADGRSPGIMALVDPDRCVSCGVCVGSCDSMGVALPGLDARDARRQVEGWLDEARARGEPLPGVALVCEEAAALELDAATGRVAGLAGWRVQLVPCSAWVHTISVEQALLRGAPEVLVVGCSPCHTREGGRWTAARLAGERHPRLRRDKVDASRVRLVEVDRLDAAGLARLAARTEGAPPSRRARVAAGLAVGGALGAAMVAGSELPYAPPRREAPELVVSFKHPGQLGEVTRQLTAQEQAGRPRHMRQDAVRERRRAPVRLQVLVDGREALARVYPPGGLWGDGASVALERLQVAPGARRVEVRIGDDQAQAAWAHVEAQPLSFERDTRRVVLFDRTRGFTWE